jgi:hypothetical protein
MNILLFGSHNWLEGGAGSSPFWISTNCKVLVGPELPGAYGVREEQSIVAYADQVQCQHVEGLGVLMSLQDRNVAVCAK